jgi:hypothetical protein
MKKTMATVRTERRSTRRMEGDCRNTTGDMTPTTRMAIGLPGITRTRIMVVTRTETKIIAKTKTASMVIGLRSITETMRGMRGEKVTEEAMGTKIGTAKRTKRRVRRDTKMTLRVRGIVVQKIVATMNETKKYVSNIEYLRNWEFSQPE